MGGRGGKTARGNATGIREKFSPGQVLYKAPSKSIQILCKGLEWGIILIQVPPLQANFSSFPQTLCACCQRYPRWYFSSLTKMQAHGSHHFKPSHFPTTTHNVSQFQCTPARLANKISSYPHAEGTVSIFTAGETDAQKSNATFPELRSVYSRLMLVMLAFTHLSSEL